MIEYEGPQEKKSSPWPGLVALLIMCLTVIIVVWMLTR